MHTKRDTHFLVFCTMQRMPVLVATNARGGAHCIKFSVTHHAMATKWSRSVSATSSAPPSKARVPTCLVPRSCGMIPAQCSWNKARTALLDETLRVLLVFHDILRSGHVQQDMVNVTLIILSRSATLGECHCHRTVAGARVHNPQRRGCNRANAHKGVACSTKRDASSRVSTDSRSSKSWHEHKFCCGCCMACTRQCREVVLIHEVLGELRFDHEHEGHLLGHAPSRRRCQRTRELMSQHG